MWCSERKGPSPLFILSRISNGDHHKAHAVGLCRRVLLKWRMGDTGNREVRGKGRKREEKWVGREQCCFFNSTATLLHPPSLWAPLLRAVTNWHFMAQELDAAVATASGVSKMLGPWHLPSPLPARKRATMRGITCRMCFMCKRRQDWLTSEFDCWTSLLRLVFSAVHSFAASCSPRMRTRVKSVVANLEPKN